MTIQICDSDREKYNNCQSDTCAVCGYDRLVRCRAIRDENVARNHGLKNEEEGGGQKCQL